MKQTDPVIEWQRTDLPLTPLFLCRADGDWIELEETVATESALLKLTPSKKDEFITYSADGTKWRMRYEGPASSVLARLVQYIRGPKIEVPVRWDRSGKYHPDELRAAFLKVVDHDDALTQFVEREELVTRLNAAASFQEFVRIWHWLGMNC